MVQVGLKPRRKSQYDLTTSFVGFRMAMKGPNFYLKTLPFQGTPRRSFCSSCSESNSRHWPCAGRLLEDDPLWRAQTREIQAMQQEVTIPALVPVCSSYSKCFFGKKTSQFQRNHLYQSAATQEKQIRRCQPLQL